MPIISSTKSDEEIEIRSILEKSSDSESKRKKAAKKFTFLSLAMILASMLVFAFFDKQVGLLCAVLSSSVPSFVNLLDD